MPPAPNLATPFEWVQSSDGRLEPFDADQICHSLFEATRRIGTADAFLARELTDGVLHFLLTERDAAIPTADWIADTVTKVVRELGHPAIARAFADRPGDFTSRIQTANPTSGTMVLAGVAQNSLELAVSLGQARLREAGLREVFSAEVAAAQEDGFLDILGLSCPLELWGGVLPTGKPERILERLLDARRWIGEQVHLDSPEHELALHEAHPVTAVSNYLQQLGMALRQTRLRATVHLNAPTPPWAAAAAGPLFAAAPVSDDRNVLTECRSALLETCARQEKDDNQPLRVAWHFTTPKPGDTNWSQLARFLECGLALTFVLQRKNSVVRLGGGFEQRTGALLLAVDLQLPRLLNRLQGRPAPERMEAFLTKLGPLVRLAASAGVQKRRFLRRCRPELERAFLLERARLLCVPQGLAKVVQALTGDSLESPRGLQLASRILSRLALEGAESRRTNGMEMVFETRMEASREVPGSAGPEGNAIIKELQLASALQAQTGNGLLRIPLDSSVGLPAQLKSAVDFAIEHTAVQAVEFYCQPGQRKPEFPPWEG